MTQDEQNGPPENQGDPQSATSSVICPRCDRQNRPMSRFCFNCGLELPGPGNPAQAMQPPTPPPSPGVTPSSMQQQSGMAHEQHLETSITPEQPGMDQEQPSGRAPPMQGPDTAANGASFGPIQNADERTWSTLLHLSAFLGFLLLFGSILAPLFVWLIFRGRSDMVDYHGKRALNFQISFLIYFIILFIAMIPFFIIGIIAGENEEIAAGFWATLFLLLFALFLMFVLGILSLVWTIVAAVRASRGNPPGYILSIPFLR